MSFRHVSENGQKFLNHYTRPSRVWRALSRATVAATALGSKLVVDNLFTTKTHNLDILLEAIRMSKLENRGLVTVMNHTSVADDPLTWGVLPYRYLLDPANLRWALGAENICFKNSLLSAFFSLGQVLSTKRFGEGPFQGSIDAAIHLLSPNGKYTVGSREQIKPHTALPPADDSLSPVVNSNPPSSHISGPKWVHIFPETFVHQPYAPYQHTMRYFHWGISRLLLESTKPPIVVPLFVQGLEKAFPEENLRFKSFRKNFGTPFTVGVGSPIDDRTVSSLRQEWLDLVSANMGFVPDNVYGGDLPESLKTGTDAEELRSRVALMVRDKISEVRADLGFAPELPEFGTADFWHNNSSVRIAGKPQLTV